MSLFHKFNAFLSNFLIFFNKKDVTDFHIRDIGKIGTHAYKPPSNKKIKQITKIEMNLNSIKVNDIIELN